MSRLGSGRTSSLAGVSDRTGSPAASLESWRVGSGSVIERSTSLTFFLNSRMPLPNDALISGLRLAPKSTSTMTKMIISSPKPRLPNMGSLLEEQPGDEIGDEHTEQAQQRHVERDRAQRLLENDEIERDGASRRCHAGGEELLHRARSE